MSPAIFHPAWFAANGLLKDAESEASEIQLVSDEVTVFTSEWLKVDVRANRLQLSTEQEAFAPVLRDLAVGVLSVLSHTPVKGLGINWERVYELPNQNDWHRFGHRLAPKEVWGPEFSNWGTMIVQVRAPRPEEDKKGHVDFYASPYFADPKLVNAVRFYSNDHFTYGEDPLVGTNAAVQDLSEQWSISSERYARVVAHLLTQVEL